MYCRSRAWCKRPGKPRSFLTDARNPSQRISTRDLIIQVSLIPKTIAILVLSSNIFFCLLVARHHYN